MMILFWLTMAAVVWFDGAAGLRKDGRTRRVYWVTALAAAVLGTLVLMAEETFRLSDLLP